MGVGSNKGGGSSDGGSGAEGSSEDGSSSSNAGREVAQVNHGSSDSSDDEPVRTNRTATMRVYMSGSCCYKPAWQRRESQRPSQVQVQGTEWSKSNRLAEVAEVAKVV